MHERLPELFGVGSTLAVGVGEDSGGAVVLNDVRVLDGKILHSLLEVADGIAVCLHHGLNEFVRCRDGARWIVDESRLDAVPLSLEPQPLRLAQRVQVQAVHSNLALQELAFRALLASVFRHGPLVLGTEATAQLDVAATRRARRRRRG